MSGTWNTKLRKFWNHPQQRSVDNKGHLTVMITGFHVRTNGTRTTTLRMEDFRKKTEMDF